MFDLLKLLFLISCGVCLVNAGCRQQESHECESICRKELNGKLTCELRGAVILPKESPFITSQATIERIRPVIHFADKKIRNEQILPDFIKINWKYYDDQCDAAIATIHAIDAYAKHCSHFIIGPSCEYTVSAISRIVKYFYNDGLNIITAAAFSFDFSEPKQTCSDQYHMLQRVGMVSFEQIANFMGKIMKKFKWKNSVFLYERDGYYDIGGTDTCRLMMSAVAKEFREENLKYSPYELIPTDNTTEARKEDLKREVGTKNGSK
ncbi:hypothetical protein PVAND_009599 [Polypedilum vanderplanki]|uniref:Receptor ligand binding region domain-containing protein n=1 Tax=Polypedilum vanderplanki TaxID=319348 RepID=A0A9J6CE25_POLVA|nr:hypothetical protein PVAND_009599 [Polypedilum vanderplanki]